MTRKRPNRVGTCIICGDTPDHHPTMICDLKKQDVVVHKSRQKRVRLEGMNMTQIGDIVWDFPPHHIGFDLYVQDGKVVDTVLIHLTKPCDHPRSAKCFEDVSRSQTVKETCTVCGNVFYYPWYEDVRQSAHQDPLFDDNAVMVYEG